MCLSASLFLEQRERKVTEASQLPESKHWF